MNAWRAPKGDAHVSFRLELPRGHVRNRDKTARAMKRARWEEQLRRLAGALQINRSSLPARKSAPEKLTLAAALEWGLHAARLRTAR